jgi:hypothetical protein
MHVTPFSAATILVFATASPLHAQSIEVFGGYSVNADYVQNRPAILIVDQKVSPFFSLGSGPAGFERGKRFAPFSDRRVDRICKARAQPPLACR